MAQQKNVYPGSWQSGNAPSDNPHARQQEAQFHPQGQQAQQGAYPDQRGQQGQYGTAPENRYGNSPTNPYARNPGGSPGMGEPWRDDPSHAPRYSADFEQAGAGNRFHQENDDAFDPHYRQWRDEQIRQLDADYRQWRAEYHERFSNEFNEWRRHRAQTGSKAEQGGENADPVAKKSSNQQ